jgi:hypothetical protein
MWQAVLQSPCQLQTATDYQESACRKQLSENNVFEIIYRDLSKQYIDVNSTLVNKYIS